MANTARTVALAVALVSLAGPHVSAHAQEILPTLAPPSHVRSRSPSITSVIQQAGERSATFRRLVETINASTSYVYVDEGECRDSDERGCLVNVTVAGPYRFVFVHVATGKADWDLMGSIGHERRNERGELAKVAGQTDVDYALSEECAVTASTWGPAFLARRSSERAKAAAGPEVVEARRGGGSFCLSTMFIWDCYRADAACPSYSARPRDRPPRTARSSSPPRCERCVRRSTPS